MPKYQNKPRVIEAEQWFPGKDVPGVEFDEELTQPSARYVTTIQKQRVFLTAGDWVVKESDGVHYYPVATKEFEKLYQPVPTTPVGDGTVTRSEA